MSWWDTKTITALATSALKTAQEKIDKVLDIKEESDGSNIFNTPTLNTDDFFNEWIEKKELYLSPESHTNNITNSESYTHKLITISSDKRTVDDRGIDANIITPKAQQCQIILDSSLMAPKDPFNLVVSKISAFDHFKFGEKNVADDDYSNDLEEVDKINENNEGHYSQELNKPLENDKNNKFLNCTLENMKIESNFTLNSFLLNDNMVNANINDMTEFGKTERQIEADCDLQFDSLDVNLINQYDTINIVYNTSISANSSQSKSNETNANLNKTIENLIPEQIHGDDISMKNSLYNSNEFNEDLTINSSQMESYNYPVEKYCKENIILITKNENEPKIITKSDSLYAEIYTEESKILNETNGERINLFNNVSNYERIENNGNELQSKELNSILMKSDNFENIFCPLTDKENNSDSTLTSHLDIENENINNFKTCMNKVDHPSQNITILRDVKSTGSVIISTLTNKDEYMQDAKSLKETPSIANLASSSSTIKDEVSLEGSLIDTQEMETEMNDDNSQTGIVLEHSNLDENLELSRDDIKIIEQNNKLMVEAIFEVEDHVENMIGEAMNEMQNQEEKNGSSEGSACMVSPGHNSGHTSADEIETTTSSDIEIVSHISTPSQNKPTTLSPSQRGLQNLHRRTDSGSSGQSLHSINSDDLVASAIFKSSNFSRKGYIGDLSTKQLYIDRENLLKKLGEVAEKLDSRERRLMTLSEENANLQESNNILRCQLEQFELIRSDNDTGIRSMQDEFMQRITELDKKNKSLLKERDSLKEVLKEIDHHNRQKLHGFEVTIKEKEQMIAELMEEGDKLSKQQLQTNSILKKLRAKEKETEDILKQLRLKNDNLKSQGEIMAAQIKINLEEEKKHIDLINQLDENLKMSKEEINKLTNDLEDSVEKARSFKVALDNSYKEIGELHKARLTESSVAQKIASDVELAANQKLRQLLDEHVAIAKKNENQLLSQIEDMQIGFTRSEKDFKRREDLLKQETSDLQQRLQEAENRNQELSQNVTAVTRPLIRQIENIQSSFSVHSSNFEKIERSLSERLYDSQAQLASALEKERLMNENFSELTNKIATLQTNNLSLKNMKHELEVKLEELQFVVENCEDKHNKNILQKNIQLKKLEDEIKTVKKEMMLIESQLEAEKIKSVNEQKKYSLLKDQFQEKEMLIENLSTQCHTASIEKLRSNLSTPINDQLIRSDSLLSQSYTLGDIQTNTKTSLYESMRHKSNNTSTFVEHLQSMLQLKSGELLQLQENIGQLERSRESMSKELVRQTVENEKLQQKFNETLPMQKQIYELNERYNALLQMYGEKVEVISELELDIAELKEMYRLQLNELLELKSHSKLED